MYNLQDFIDGNYFKIDGDCKKLKSWCFQSENYCVRDCEVTLYLFFEDGSIYSFDELDSLELCD